MLWVDFEHAVIRPDINRQHPDAEAELNELKTALKYEMDFEL